MVFTDAEFCDLVLRRAHRAGTQDIKMLVCPLAPDLGDLLRQVLDKASMEQRATE